MLVIQNKSSFFSFKNDEYYNDDIELKKISKNRKISIIQNSKKCKCKFLLENEKLLNLTKKSLIDKLNNLKELTYDCSNINNFYDVNFEIRKDLPLFIFPTTPITQNFLHFGFSNKL